MSAPRFATVHLPAFGLQSAVRARPELRRRPLVLERGARVAECSRLAARAGIREGHTVARARLEHPELVVLPFDPEGEGSVRRELLEALVGVSPRIEWAGGGTFHLDAIGLDRLFDSERAVLARCLEVVRDAGLAARVGMAGTRFASACAARCHAGLTVVPAGGEAAFLAPLPVSAIPRLAQDRRVRERLELLGVRTLGDLARLPADGLAARFGREVARCRRLALGEEPEPLVPVARDEGPRIERELDVPVEGLEPVTFLLKTCCEELADRLEERGRAASIVGLRLLLDAAAGERADERLLRPSRPLAGARALLDLCRIELEVRPVAAPISGLVLAAPEEVERTAEDGRLFGRRLDLAGLSLAVDRCTALLGPERVLTPDPRPAHRREARIGWRRFEPERASSRNRPADGAPGTSPTLDVGEPDDVALPQEGERVLPRPRPARVRLPRASEQGMLVVPGDGGLRARLVARIGPHRVTGEWWDGGADVDRDEYVLLGDDGGVYRTFLDRRRRQWFLLSVLD